MARFVSSARPRCACQACAGLWQIHSNVEWSFKACSCVSNWLMFIKRPISPFITHQTLICTTWPKATEGGKRRPCVSIHPLVCTCIFVCTWGGVCASVRSVTHAAPLSFRPIWWSASLECEDCSLLVLCGHSNVIVMAHCHNGLQNIQIGTIPRATGIPMPITNIQYQLELQPLMADMFC